MAGAGAGSGAATGAATGACATVGASEAGAGTDRVRTGVGVGASARRTGCGKVGAGGTATGSITGAGRRTLKGLDIISCACRSPGSQPNAIPCTITDARTAQKIGDCLTLRRGLSRNGKEGANDAAYIG